MSTLDCDHRGLEPQMRCVRCQRASCLDCTGARGMCIRCTHEASASARPIVERASRRTTGLLWLFIATGTVGLVVSDTDTSGVADVVAFVQALSLIATAVAFCAWIHRCVQWLAPMTQLPFGPHAWAWFFVPIMNLWRPFQVVAALWKGRTRLPEAPGILHAWWGCWLTWNTSFYVGQKLTERATTPDALATASVVHTLFEVVGLVAAYLAVRVLREVTGAGPAESSAAGGEPAVRVYSGEPTP